MNPGLSSDVSPGMGPRTDEETGLEGLANALKQFQPRRVFVKIEHEYGKKLRWEIRDIGTGAIIHQGEEVDSVSLLFKFESVMWFDGKLRPVTRDYTVWVHKDTITEAVIIKVKLPDGWAQLVGKNIRPYALTPFKRWHELDWDHRLRVYTSYSSTEDEIDRILKRIKRDLSIKVIEITREEPYNGYKDSHKVREQREELRRLFASVDPQIREEKEQLRRLLASLTP